MTKQGCLYRLKWNLLSFVIGLVLLGLHTWNVERRREAERRTNISLFAAIVDRMNAENATIQQAEAWVREADPHGRGIYFKPDGNGRVDVMVGPATWGWNMMLTKDLPAYSPEGSWHVVLLEGREPSAS